MSGEFNRLSQIAQQFTFDASPDIKAAVRALSDTISKLQSAHDSGKVTEQGLDGLCRAPLQIFDDHNFEKASKERPLIAASILREANKDLHSSLEKTVSGKTGYSTESARSRY